MTAVGKILVFLNLVFSLVVGAFVIMMYLARTHWVDEYKKVSDQAKVLAASEQTYRNEAIKAQQDSDAKVAKAVADLKKIQADLETQIAENTQMRDRLAKAEQLRTGDSALASLSTSEVAKRQADVSQLRDSLKKETEVNSGLVKKNNELIEQATAATIEKQAALALSKRMEEQVQQMARDMERMRASGGRGTATVRDNRRNPPPESVEGLVKSTDSSGLMTISIGSDAGLSRGQTLEVFRLSSIPSQSKYLGTIRILEATPTQAVAQPVGRMASPPQAGDRVASRILGS
jgi:hypothetical protein